jgi:hypothetical protein
MSLSYRVVPLPDVWPGGARTPSHERQRPQFKTVWTRALDLLDREVFQLDGTNVEIAVDVAPAMLRADGQLRADARPRSPAVVVSFDTPTGRLVFAADLYSYWQENVDAIARSLEKMRAVDRYGVLQGRHYSGFKALPAKASTGLTAQQAAELLETITGDGAAQILRDRFVARAVIREAQRVTHPDGGGTADAFHRVSLAKQALAAHHGGAL